MRRALHYLFVAKDPTLLRWRWRKPLGAALVMVGTVQALAGLLVVLGR